MKLKMSSQFTRGEIEKAVESLFDLFQIKLPAYVLSGAIGHLCSELHRYCDDHSLANYQILGVRAEFDRSVQLLCVYVNNKDQMYWDDFVLRVDAAHGSIVKGNLRKVPRGITKVA